MTLAEMKKSVLKLIEEYEDNEKKYTSDPDIYTKMNDVINNIMFDVCKFKKLSAYIEINVEEDETINLYDILERFNQLNKITNVDFNIVEQFVTFNESGKAKIYYYKNPVAITENTEDDYIFELSEELYPVMMYGIAGDILKNDVSANYGNLYSNKYKELIQQIDPRVSTTTIRIEGGLDV